MKRERKERKLMDADIYMNYFERKWQFRSNLITTFKVSKLLRTWFSLLCPKNVFCTWYRDYQCKWCDTWDEKPSTHMMYCRHFKGMLKLSSFFATNICHFQVLKSYMSTLHKMISWFFRQRVRKGERKRRLLREKAVVGGVVSCKELTR